MKRSFAQSLACCAFAMVLFAVLFSCKKSSSNSSTTTTTTTHPTGWSGSDNPATVPQAVNVTTMTGSSGPLPSKVDLTPYLPPIGDQGQTGTCVAWSTAYYTKTASEAIAFNYSTSTLTSASYEMSPKDMYLSIPDSLKDVTCMNGTNITYALDVMVANGVATLATVPWDPSITDCSQSLVQASWNEDAANHKIAFYRTITATVAGIKQQLAANNPVMIGIKVSTDYENWTGSGVLSTFTGSSLGLHAQTIVGYDDNQGSEGAFRIANSWNTSWGDNGFIWVDYNTLVNQYIDGGNAYYMCTSGSNNNVTPPTTTTTTNVDIAPWVFSDVSTYSTTNDPTSRTMYLNIYNIGTGTATASTGWGIYYVYYNAFNANDYGIIFNDEFNNSIASDTYSCPTNDACTYNYDIPGGSDFATVAFSDPEIYRNYNVPSITGYYYLVLIADPNNALEETNMQNNIFYTTGQVPAAFSNGYTAAYDPNSGGIRDHVKNTLETSPENLKLSKYNSSVGQHNRNAYTPEEILSFVKTKYQSGELKRKAIELHATASKRPRVHQVNE